MEYNGGAKNPSTIKYNADKVYTKNLFRIIVLQIYGPPPPTTSKFRAVKLSCLLLSFCIAFSINNPPCVVFKATAVVIRLIRYYRAFIQLIHVAVQSPVEL